MLRLVAKGLSYKQIAERLVLSHRTVQNHVQNTLRKLQLHNRVQLVRYAIEQGLDERRADTARADSPAGRTNRSVALRCTRREKEHDMGQGTLLFRASLGDVLRAERMRQGMTLRELSSLARVSLGYISEIERGQKEASSELLAALCEALDVPLSGVLREVSDYVEAEELALEVVTAPTVPGGVSPPPPEPSATPAAFSRARARRRGGSAGAGGAARCGGSR